MITKQDESVCGLEEGIGGVVCIECWQIFLCVNVCGDWSSIAVVCDATESETIGFDGGCFVGIRLEHTRRRKQASFDVRDIVRRSQFLRDLEESQGTKQIMDSPTSDCAMAFDSETFDDTF
jgi:hypothetical protein